MSDDILSKIISELKESTKEEAVPASFTPETEAEYQGPFNEVVPTFEKIDDNTYEYIFRDGFIINLKVINTYMYDDSYGICLLEEILLNDSGIREFITVFIHMEEDSDLLSLVNEQDFSYLRNFLQFQDVGYVVDSFLQLDNQPICYWATLFNNGEMSYSLKEKYLDTHNNFNCNNPDAKNMQNGMFTVCESHVENYPASGYVGSCRKFKLDLRDITSSKQLENNDYIFIAEIRTNTGIQKAVIRTTSSELDDVSSYLFMEWFDKTKHSDLIDMGNIYEKKVEIRPTNFSLLKSIGAEISK